jgi:hypothetical protein
MNDLFAEYIDACRHRYADMENENGKEWEQCRVCGVVRHKESGVE